MPLASTVGASSSTRPKKALFLLRYSSLAAGTRVRLLQYRPYLESHGWSVDTHAFWDDAFLHRLYAGGRRSLRHYATALVKRAQFLASHNPREYDAVVVHQDVFPWLPFFLERLFYRGAVHLVLDLDDAIYVSYHKYPWLHTKYESLFQHMREINVGNETLAEYVRRFHPQVNIIPTVVDMNRYAARDTYSTPADQPIVGWIGTPITARYLQSYAATLAEVARFQPFRLRCVGVQPGFVLPGVEVEPIPWSEQAEAGLIRSFDIGIMPLAQEEFAKGKCGYKLVQYMACAVPALGTAIGANKQIITDGVNGLLAADQDEFGRKLLLLLQRPELRRELGQQGRRTIEERFSLQSQQSRFLASLERAAATRLDVVSGRLVSPTT